MALKEKWIDSINSIGEQELGKDGSGNTVEFLGLAGRKYYRISYSGKAGNSFSHTKGKRLGSSFEASSYKMVSAYSLVIEDIKPEEAEKLRIKGTPLFDLETGALIVTPISVVQVPARGNGEGLSFVNRVIEALKRLRIP